ncbi:MAG: carboxy-S-adenosyl-L-methionine synthase CmoA [Zetaproteobacteria bacterium]|nr:carboxy-S-adenosyl-L-methionine synthase CmoA [Zetaproteobacteria bacterium]
MKQDKIYAQAHANLGSFRFDSQVTDVFADMIQRSVPGYGLSLDMLAVIATEYAQENSQIYDLGCSLGASTLAICHGIQVQGCNIIGVDNAPAMIAQCQSYIDADHSCSSIQLQCADIQDVVIENASMVVLNFTLQFIPVEKRQALLTRIAQGLRKGGVLILSEKIRFEDENENHRQIALHEGFKRSQGYSDIEISQKRQALEQVLIPETLKIHHQRLHDAGFQHSQTWFQCFNFTSILAFK